jgi:glutathione peroxidase
MSIVMSILLSVLQLLGLSDLPAKKTPEQDEPKLKSIYDATMKDIDGNDVALSKYEGEVLLIVNVASKCGLTPQYEALESLHREYKDRGLKVLAFPANNFMKQEPGTSEEIKTFCRTKYDVTFDLFAKVSVKGGDICPLYRYLTDHADKKVAGEVDWNFQKYLVARNGTVLAKFSPRTKPDDKDLKAKLEEALAAPRPEKKAEKPAAPTDQ